MITKEPKLQIILGLHQDYFELIKSPDHPLHNLARFLTDDVGMGSWISGYKSWIFDSSYNETEGNYCALKKDGDKITIGRCFEDDQFKFAVTVSATSLYNLLNEWEKICKEMPEEFTITLDGYDLKVEITKPSQQKES